MALLTLVFSALVVTGAQHAEARRPGAAQAGLSNRALLSKQRYTTQRARLDAWPRPMKSGGAGGWSGITDKKGVRSSFTTRTGRKVDNTAYRAIPKRVRRQLQPRVQRILKQLANTGQRGPATFDGDGTLWAGDVGEGFFSWMLRKGHYPQERIPMLWRAWRSYKAGNYNGEKMYELMVTSLAGMRESRVQQLARQYFDGKHLHRIYRPSANLIAALRSMGIEPWVVSGSPYWVVAAGARHLGIPANRVIGLSVKVDSQGKLTDQVVRPVPWKTGKAKRIMQQVGRVPILAAGNSYGDIQMLKTASELSLVVNPCPATLRQARSFNWVVHRYNRADELARSVGLLPAPRGPAGLLAPPAGSLPAPATGHRSDVRR